jgi:hypothetical protein
MIHSSTSSVTLMMRQHLALRHSNLQHLVNEGVYEAKEYAENALKIDRFYRIYD